MYTEPGHNCFTDGYKTKTMSRSIPHLVPTQSSAIYSPLLTHVLYNHQAFTIAHAFWFSPSEIYIIVIACFFSKHLEPTHTSIFKHIFFNLQWPAKKVKAIAQLAVAVPEANAINMPNYAWNMTVSKIFSFSLLFWSICISQKPWKELT